MRTLQQKFQTQLNISVAFVFGFEGVTRWPICFAVSEPHVVKAYSPKMSPNVFMVPRGVSVALTIFMEGSLMWFTRKKKSKQVDWELVARVFSYGVKAAIIVAAVVTKKAAILDCLSNQSRRNV